MELFVMGVPVGGSNTKVLKASKHESRETIDMFVFGLIFLLIIAWKRKELMKNITMYLSSRKSKFFETSIMQVENTFAIVTFLL